VISGAEGMVLDERREAKRRMEAKMRTGEHELKVRSP
jgi:hypothetical protein